MKKKRFFWITIGLIGLICLFFYQTIFFGKVPFPGDILVSDFQPWRSASYMGYAPGGIPNKAQYPDTVRQMYPWKTHVVKSLQNGKLPLWNPYNFSGAPLFANFQNAALYPLGILYLFLSQIDAWTILVILQPLLATLFTYLYARKIGIGTLGSILAALSYGFSGFMSVWLEYNTVGHVILWLPLILLAIENNWFGVLALSHTAALLAGHPQVYAYMFVFTSVYACFRSQHKKLVFVFSMLGVGIAGIQLIPGIELIANAARSPHDPNNLFTKILIQPWQLLALPFPNLFGNPATRTYMVADTFVGKVTTIGLIPLFFLLSAFRRKDALTRWFKVATAGVFLLITANPITYFLYKNTGSSPTLMSFLLAFSLSVLCGMGLDFWMTDKHSMKKLVTRFVQIIIILLVLGFVYRNPVSQRALFYGGLVSAATLSLFWVAINFPKFRLPAIVVLLIVHALDLFVFFNRFNPFVPKPLVFPDHPILTFLQEKTPDRYWGYGTAAIGANYATQYGIFSPEGYDPLYPKPYGQFIHNSDYFTDKTRSDAAIPSHFGDGGLSDPQKRRLLNWLSVRYILNRVENGSNAMIPDTFRKIFEFESWQIFENPDAVPRTFMENGTATIRSYAPDRIVIETQSTISGTLVITDTYYPGWNASVDTTRVPISRYGAFRSLLVPSGTHTIVMRYEPNSVKAGIFVSIVCITATLFLCRKKSFYS